MAKRRVRLFFTGELITEPIVWGMGKHFDVITNIRGGEVLPDTGWLYVELTGEDEELDRAVEYAIERGVRVDPVEGDVIAG